MALICEATARLWLDPISWGFPGLLAPSSLLLPHYLPGLHHRRMCSLYRVMEAIHPFCQEAKTALLSPQPGQSTGPSLSLAVYITKVRMCVWLTHVKKCESFCLKKHTCTLLYSREGSTLGEVGSLAKPFIALDEMLQIYFQPISETRLCANMCVCVCALWAKDNSGLLMTLNRFVPFSKHRGYSSWSRGVQVNWEINHHLCALQLLITALVVEIKIKVDTIC